MDNAHFISDNMVKEKSPTEPTHSKFCKYILYILTEFAIHAIYTYLLYAHILGLPAKVPYKIIVK